MSPARWAAWGAVAVLAAACAPLPSASTRHQPVPRLPRSPSPAALEVLAPPLGVGYGTLLGPVRGQGAEALGTAMLSKPNLVLQFACLGSGMLRWYVDGKDWTGSTACNGAAQMDVVLAVKSGPRTFAIHAPPSMRWRVRVGDATGTP